MYMYIDVDDVDDVDDVHVHVGISCSVHVLGCVQVSAVWV